MMLLIGAAKSSSMPVSAIWAFVGMFVLVLVCLAVLHTRRLSRAVRVLAIVVAACGNFLLIRYALSRVDRAGHGVSAASQDPAVRLAALDSSMRAIEDGERSAPRDRWDPDYVVSAVGRDPQRLFAWVRDNTSWIPYRGTLRGPVGVLMDRQGNSLDRALLLASLLTRAGHTVRLAHAELSVERARELLPKLAAERRRAAPVFVAGLGADWQSDLLRRAAAYGGDSARVVRTIAARVDGASRMLQKLDARTAEQTSRLERVLQEHETGDGERDRLEQALAATRDHWWVQWRANDAWMDLDVSMPRGPTDAPASATLEPSVLDSALYHRVVLRLVTERQFDGGFVQERSLEREIRPSEVIGVPIALQIMPADWNPGLIANARDRAAAFRTIALEQPSWLATISVGTQDPTTAIISATSGAGGTKTEESGGAFGGLGRSIAGALQDPKKRTGELTAVWLEYELRAPDRPPQVIRRQLFDLVGPAARAAKRPLSLPLSTEQRLERSLGLFRSTEILPLASAVAPEYLLHLTAAAALANRKALRTSVPPVAPSPAEEIEQFERVGVPLPSDLYTLAVVRMDADADAEVFLDRPNILTRHVFLGSRAESLVRREATDIVANEVGVALGVYRPAEVRRRQGVRDTNAEALLYLDQRVSGSVAERFADTDGWVSVTTPNDRVLTDVPADIRQRMTEDLAAGYVIVAPGPRSLAGTPELVGWWRTDPRTGQTLGVSGTGWGETLVERIFSQRVLLASAVVEAWFFEFLICGGAVTGSSSSTVASRGSAWDWLVTPLYAAEGGNPCVWEAWKAGVAAGMLNRISVVWPLLVDKYDIIRHIDYELNRPAFASGESAPGDAPPIFGKSPNAPTKAPPPECPPGSGAAGGSGAGSAAEAGPGGTAGGAAGESQPRPQTTENAAEPGVDPLGRTQAARKPAPSDEPYYLDEVDGDMRPLEPDQLEGMMKVASQRIANAEEELARQQASAREAAQEAEQAKQVIADAKANPPAPSDEALQRLSNADGKIRDAERAQRAVAEAEAVLARARLLADNYRRLVSLNNELIQARAQLRDAYKRFADAFRSGKADFQGDDYAQYKQVSDRYERALKQYVAADRAIVRNEPVPGSPGAGQPNGVTQPMPNAPVPPGPGQTQPLGDSPTVCGGGGQASNSSPPAAPAPPSANVPPTSAQNSDAQRQLADAERELEAAKAERDQLYRAMDEALEKMFADEAAAVAAGREPPQQSRENAELLIKKIDASNRLKKIEDAYYRARYEVEQLERANAMAGAAPAGGSADVPQAGVPQSSTLIGLGAMGPPK